MTSQPDPYGDVARRASGAIAAGDPSAWFEPLYETAARGDLAVPWDRGGPHPLLVEWAYRHHVDGAGRRAMVVGSGLGGDAEFVASLGFATSGFDVSETAVSTTRARFPESSVQYSVANLLERQPQLRGRFDFVLESLTVQALPRSVRDQATAAVRGLVAPGGVLLVISGALGNGDPVHGPPWRLTRVELDQFGRDGLTASDIEDLPDASGTGSPVWRATFVHG
ncbi:MAG: class I SAM-dependent methyltransferase [Jatrophihabitantaceae bacterium]